MGSSTDPTIGGGGSTPEGAFAAERVFCVDEINRHRATVGRSALRRSETLEAFASLSVQHDATMRVPHAYFRSVNGGGISHAETQILWWRGYSVREVIQRGLNQMWQVGPGGEHYDILAGPYEDVGCGVHVQDGEVSIAQEFR